MLPPWSISSSRICWNRSWLLMRLIGTLTAVRADGVTRSGARVVDSMNTLLQVNTNNSYLDYSGFVRRLQAFLWRVANREKRRVAAWNHDAVSIMPPPRQMSPLYNTADCPGVTAHCGVSKDSAKSAPTVS